jgi:hypothetical protein
MSTNQEDSKAKVQYRNKGGHHKKEAGFHNDESDDDIMLRVENRGLTTLPTDLGRWMFPVDQGSMVDSQTSCSVSRNGNELKR